MFQSKKRIMVTGGAGMIGSNLVKILAQDEVNEVYVADNLWRGRIENLMNDGVPVFPISTNFSKVDLRDLGSCLHVLKGINEVYHLADIVAGINYVFGNEMSLFRDNILINSNVLKAAEKSGVKKFLYVGTACSYPKEKQFSVQAPPLKEADVYPANPESAYGWSKLIGEYETLLYGQETRMRTSVLRMHNVYGTPCDYSPERSQVIPSLIRKAILFPDEPFIVWGTGEQGRSFLHIDDVVRALTLLMEKNTNNETVQIGTKNCITIREISEMIVAISGKDIQIEYDKKRPEGDKGRSADCKKAERLLGWRPMVPLSEGLERTYRWIEKQMSSEAKP